MLLKEPSNLAVFGAIAIYTKRGKFIPDDSTKYNVKAFMPLGFQPPAEFYAPKCDTPESRENKTLDLRTTIYWQPVVQTDSLGVASFDFYAADEATSYSVVIEGLTNDGKIIRQYGKLGRED